MATQLGNDEVDALLSQAGLSDLRPRFDKLGYSTVADIAAIARSRDALQELGLGEAELRRLRHALWEGREVELHARRRHHWRRHVDASTKKPPAKTCHEDEVGKLLHDLKLSKFRPGFAAHGCSSVNDIRELFCCDSEALKELGLNKIHLARLRRALSVPDSGEEVQRASTTSTLEEGALECFMAALTIFVCS